MVRISALLLLAVLIPLGCGSGDPVVKVVMETTEGRIEVEVHPHWAPIGAARFLELVKRGFYDGCAFYRVVPDILVQAGINGDPQVHRQWEGRMLADEPRKVSNRRGTVAFAKLSRADSRTTEFFINLADNGKGFDNSQAGPYAPFGRVTAATMPVADRLFGGYRGAKGPHFAMLTNLGNSYLAREFPELDYIKKAYINN